jgi:hypothetical protein
VSAEATSVAHETVNALFQKFIGPFSATMITPLLVEPSSIEERVSTLVHEFNVHPHLLAPFRKLIASLQNKEVVASIEEQIRFFQSTQARNYLFVNLFQEVLQIKELKLDLDTGRLPAKPNDLLKFSHTARVEFGEESRYKDLMYAAGLLFDFAYYLQKTQIVNTNGVKLDDFIQNCFKKGIEQGKLITRLSRHKPKLTNEKHAPVAALLRQLSHVIFCLLYPNIGPDFYKKLAAIRYTEPLKLSMEIKEFGVHSGMLASYIAESFDIFDPLGEVMSVWGMPHLAHYTKNKAIHDLAAIAELGVILRESFKIIEISETNKVGVNIPELTFLDYTLSARVREDLDESEKKPT